MPEKEMFMMIEHLTGNLSMSSYSHPVVCLFCNGPHEAIHCLTANQGSISVVTNQEGNHQQEAPRQESAAISSTISTVLAPKKGNDFEKSIKSLEKKWEEKFLRQEAIIEKLEAQLAHVTELLTTTLQSAELKEKQDEGNQTEFP